MVRHQLPLVGCSEAGRAASLLHIIDELAHGFLSDDAALAARERILRFIEGCQQFDTGALAALPQGHCFLHGVFLAAEAATLDGVTHKRLLVGGEVYFHSALTITL